MEDSEQIISSMNILRRINPRHSEELVKDFVTLFPNLKTQIPSRTLSPFQKIFDAKESKYFLACEYNKSDNCFRSPWTNTYYPTAPKAGYFPSKHLRILEHDFNKLLEQFIQIYYRTGISSAYLIESPSKTGFLACFCIKSEFEDLLEDNTLKWDSMHVVEVTQDAFNVIYTVTAFLKISLENQKNEANQYDFNCNLDHYDKIKKDIKSFELDKLEKHILTIGEIIENTEYDFKNKVNQIFIPKIEEVVEFTCP